MSTKSALRETARKLRDQLKSIHAEAPTQLADRFPEKLLTRFGPMVSGYIAIGSELDPAPVLRRIQRLGAKVCYPRIEADDQMTFRVIKSEDDLEQGRFGLTQPGPHTEMASPTLVLAPLLAFDAAGNRLGYGKGHYDRALARLRESGRVFVCGLAYSDQEVVTIPTEPTDIPLDWIVTETGSIPLFLARAATSAR